MQPGEGMNQVTSLIELFDTPDPPVDRALLVLAQDAYPQLLVHDYLTMLDEMARLLEARVATARDVATQASILGTYIYNELGFRGDEQTYYDPRNSYLNEVLERRLGIPISLAAVLIAVGTRAGLTIEGVGFPGHFLVRLGGQGGIYLDPFSQARIVSKEMLETLCHRALGPSAVLTPEHLAPVGTRAMVVRTLSNLKAIYGSQRDYARALLVCDRLVDLTSLPEQRRDRGLYAVALGAFAAAAADLNAYLTARPRAADAEQVRTTLARIRAQPQARHSEN